MRATTELSRAAASATALTVLLWSSACAGTASPPDPPPAPQAIVASEAVEASPAPSEGSTPAVPESLLVNEDEYQGWRYYHIYCARCHGQDALGSANAADLRHSVSEEGGIGRDSFVVIVRDGSADNAEMKGFADLLEDARIGQIYLYVIARGEGRLAMGRPHRRQTPP
jgi:mono/diheme cytochrome c family protein